MNSLPRKLIALSTLGLVSACGLFPPTLVEQDIVRLEIEKTQPIWVSTASVYMEDDKTVVRGEARYPMGAHFGFFSGHIDIDLTLPNGEVFKKRNVRLIRKRIPKRSGRRATFVSRFPLDPSKGTIVHIEYHLGEHKGKGTT
tara:strand:- start:14832 stop:15257 length:426 start_codon:yes stop_codon:yes gene_type:complete